MLIILTFASYSSRASFIYLLIRPPPKARPRRRHMRPRTVSVDTILIASKRSDSFDQLQNPPPARREDRKPEFSVSTPAANGLRTCTGGPATPIRTPRFCSSASCAWAASRTSFGVRSYPARSPYPIVTNFGMAACSFVNGQHAEITLDPDDDPTKRRTVWTRPSGEILGCSGCSEPKNRNGWARRLNVNRFSGKTGLQRR